MHYICSMEEALLLGGIGILGNMFGQQSSYEKNMEMQKDQQRFNREMAEWQNQVNVANWQMMNSYNTPAAQMERLLDAGLNPNLLYGNGATATGNATAPQGASHVDSAPYTPVNYGDFGTSDAVRAYNQVRQVSAQVDNMESQADYNRANTRLSDAKAITEAFSAIGHMLDNEKSTMDLETYRAFKETNLMQAIASLGNIMANTENTEADTDLKKANTAVAYENIALIQARTGLTSAQTLSVYQGIKESAKRIALMDSQIANNNASTYGIRLNNGYLEDTYENRVTAVEQALANSVVVGKNGQVEYDTKKFELYWQQTFGHKPGGNVIQALIGSSEVILDKVANVIF